MDRKPPKNRSLDPLSLGFWLASDVGFEFKVLKAQ